MSKPRLKNNPLARFSLGMFSLLVLSGCPEKPMPPMPTAQPPMPRDDSPFKHVKFIKGNDGGEMALIPGGRFHRGSKELGGPDERPVQQVMLNAFYMDLYEVTNEEYQVFVEETGHKPPDVMVFFEDLSHLTQPPQPVVGIDWADATSYCRWVGKRLPTEAEWEKAAHGTVSMEWPWGAEFTKGYANVDGDEDGYRYSAPVGSFEPGRSPYGLYDMAGNVSEWVYDWYGANYYREGQVTLPRGPDSGDLRVYRGGSWNDRSPDSRAAKRYMAFPYRRDATVGIRCAKDAD